MMLYMLAFRREPLIKVGVSARPAARWSQLGDDRFDLPRSYLVRAENPKHIRLLERNLKVLFAECRRDVQIPLSSGNTEVFCGSALPKMLQLIESFRQSWPTAGLCIQQGIAPTVWTEPCVKPVPATHEERLVSLAERGRRKILGTIAENQRKLSELRRLASVIRFLSATVEQDSEPRYAIGVELDTTDRAAVRGLIGASRMETRAYRPRLSRSGKLYKYSPNGTAYGFESLSEPLDSKVGTLNLSFNLAMIARVQAESIEPDPTPWEALAFWKDLVTQVKHKQTEVEVAV